MTWPPRRASAAQLAMGDALAMALMAARGFSSEDFARAPSGRQSGPETFDMLKLGDVTDGAGSPRGGGPGCSGLREVVSWLFLLGAWALRRSSKTVPKEKADWWASSPMATSGGHWNGMRIPGHGLKA